MADVVRQPQVSRLRLGDLLMAAKLVTRDQVVEASGAQQDQGGRLGENLVRLGYLAESDLKRMLAKQLGLPFEQGPELDLDPAAARLITEEVATKHRVVPLRLDGTLLKVAVVDPLNFQALDHVALQTGKQVQPVVVTDTALQRAIVRVFGIPDAGSVSEELSTRLYDVDAPEENAVVKVAHNIVRQAIASRSSDIHIEPT